MRTRISTASEVFISSASIREASIKAGIGKLKVDIDELVDQISKSGIKELPVAARHAAKLGQLPTLHNDPFDRILVAQALCEPLIFLTADTRLKNHSELVEAVQEDSVN